MYQRGIIPPKGATSTLCIIAPGLVRPARGRGFLVNPLR